MISASDSHRDDTAPAVGIEAARRLLDKLREFSAGLAPDERALLGALLAPGIALAYGDDEVEGFDMVGWRPTRLPAALARAVTDRGVRVVEL